MRLHVFTSEYAGRPEEVDFELAQISIFGREKNFRLGITGILFFHEGRWLHIMEGESDAIDTLIDSFAKDNRQANMHTLIDAEVPRRGIADWHMASFKMSGSEKITIEELELITQAYIESRNIETDMVARFFRAMIESRAFANTPIAA